MEAPDGLTQRNFRGSAKPARGACLRVRRILEHIGEAISGTSAEVRVYINEHPDFADIGERILQEWQKGAALSLRAT